MSEDPRPQILITGAAGALARRVITRLRHQYRLVAVDFRQKVEFPSPIPSYCVDFNKRHFQDIFRKHHLDGVIHLGRVLTFETDRYRRYNANVLGTQKLIELSHKYGVQKMVVLSTYYVYGADAYNPAQLDEDAPLKASGLSFDLVNAVEFENLCNIFMYKYPELRMTILRPCNVAGPGVRNTLSLLLSSQFAPVMVGFSPMMQFIHVEDMADAIVHAYQYQEGGIFNVAPDDWVPYRQALQECGCVGVPIPSIPPTLTTRISKILGWKAFPSFLINHFKYPVVIDGSRFQKSVGFEPKRSLKDIFAFYRNQKDRSL